MSATRYMSHSPICACGLLERVPFASCSRYVLTTALSSFLDLGVSPFPTSVNVVGVQNIDDGDKDVPSNIESFLALEFTQVAVHSLRLKSVAPKNMPSMSFTLDTSHFDRSPLNDVAPRNIPRMSLALDTSHFDRSLSKNLARANMRLMSVTRDTSQVPIGPCGLLRHWPFGDNFRHASTALLSCTLDRGENAGVGLGLSSNDLTVWGQGPCEIRLKQCAHGRSRRHRPLQTLGEMLIDSEKKTIQRCHGRQMREFGFSALLRPYIHINGNLG